MQTRRLRLKLISETMERDDVKGERKVNEMQTEKKSSRRSTP